MLLVMEAGEERGRPTWQKTYDITTKTQLIAKIIHVWNQSKSHHRAAGDRYSAIYCISSVSKRIKDYNCCQRPI